MQTYPHHSEKTLKRKGEVVYVGMTKSLFGRMDKHVRGDIRFDEIVFVSAESADTDALETELIARYAPKHNIAKNVLQNNSIQAGSRVSTPL